MGAGWGPGIEPRKPAALPIRRGAHGHPETLVPEVPEPLGQ